MEISADGVAYVQLRFDPTNEANSFVGNLRMSVEGFATKGERVTSFDVPVSVVDAEELTHLK
jgi:hypothetical protein